MSYKEPQELTNLYERIVQQRNVARQELPGIMMDAMVTAAFPPAGIVKGGGKILKFGSVLSPYTDRVLTKLRVVRGQPTTSKVLTLRPQKGGVRHGSTIYPSDKMNPRWEDIEVPSQWRIEGYDPKKKVWEWIDSSQTEQGALVALDRWKSYRRPIK